MRHFLVAILTGALLLDSSAAVAQPIGNPFSDVVPPLPQGQTMTAQEVVQHAEPFVAGVGRCYRKHVPRRQARGDMDLYLVIAGGGAVIHASVTAPGVPKFRLGPLDRCVRRETATWKFPVHRGFTNVTIRYRALDTKHPAAAPLPEPRLVASADGR